ncbi:MAG: GGDEF domain-containing protein [Thermoleophilia bacterium]
MAVAASLSLLAYVLGAGLGVGPGWFTAFAVAWMPTVMSTEALALLVTRLVTRRDRTAGWWLLAGAMCLSITADLLWARLGFPDISIADAFYLGFYPLAFIAVALLVRDLVGRAGVSAWLDGVIAALCVAALASTFVLPQIAASGDGGLLSAVVNLAYPIADVVLVAGSLVALSLTGWSPRGPLGLLIAGFVVLGVGDVLYLLEVADSTEVIPAWVVQIAWSVAAFMYMGSAWRDPKEPRRQAPRSWSRLVGPAVFSAASLGLLTWLAMQGTHAVGAVLAAAALGVLLVRIVLYFREILALASGLADAEDRASRDSLTGLLNHGAFHAAADLELARAQLTGTELSLVLIDVDHFKAFNDRHGHQAGDMALRAIAACLAEAARQGDVIGRTGGEELAWALPGAALEDAGAAAERLRRRIAELRIGGVGGVTASFGVVSPAAGESARRVFGRADEVLYAAKRAGRNRVLTQPEPTAAPVTLA